MSTPCSLGVLRQWGNIIDSPNLSLGKIFFLTLESFREVQQCSCELPQLSSACLARSHAHEQSFHNVALAALAPGVGVLECDCLVVWACGLWGMGNTGLVTGTEERFHSSLALALWRHTLAVSGPIPSTAFSQLNMLLDQVLLF